MIKITNMFAYVMEWLVIFFPSVHLASINIAFKYYLQFINTSIRWPRRSRYQTLHNTILRLNNIITAQQSNSATQLLCERTLIYFFDQTLIYIWDCTLRLMDRRLVPRLTFSQLWVDYMMPFPKLIYTSTSLLLPRRTQPTHHLTKTCTTVSSGY